ncbi:MAG: PhoU domain-containing protein [Desulfurococcaceae archaeon TW002]
MDRLIASGLEELSAILHQMDKLAYRAVSTALRECVEGRDAYNEIRKMSETLSLMADQVEDKVFELIARFQPVASDLRTIKSYMKIAYDYVRFGRYALDMSYMNQKLGGIRDCDARITTHIKEMGEKALNMIRISSDSLRNRNPQLAEKIIQIEKETDKEFLNLLDKLIKETNISTRCAISSASVAIYLERIADHATYIYKSIIYITTGRKES